jgi:hypothetical protein
MVTDPESRRERFIQGLNPDLACFINIYPGTTIEFLIDKAEYHEGLNRSQAAVRSVRLRIEPGGPSTYTRSTPPPPAPKLSIGSTYRGPTAPTRRVWGRWCGLCRRTHEGPCLRGRCHICDVKGHWANTCPTRTVLAITTSPRLGTSSGRGSTSKGSRTPPTGDEGSS